MDSTRKLPFGGNGLERALEDGLENTESNSSP